MTAQPEGPRTPPRDDDERAGHEGAEYDRADDRRGHTTRPSAFVGPLVHQLQAQYLNDVPSARAVLAQLRRASTAEPGTAWDMAAYLIPPWNETQTSDEAQYDEIAIHLAMTSYARLQQSKTVEKMHIRGRTLGEAARLLSAPSIGGMDQAKVWGRLAKIAQAESVTGLTWQLRGLISLLRSKSIGLDIGRLADDLYFWQFASSKVGVQRRWSRAFFARPSGDPGNSKDGGVADQP